MIVETGAGLLTSNSFISLDDADLYHEMRLHVETWTTASDDTKEAALMWATRLLNNLINWSGYKATEGQALRWPRYLVYDLDGYLIESTVIPDFLKSATAEYARNLIETDLTEENGLAGYKKLKIDVLELEVDKYSQSATIPPAVWDMVKRYGDKYRNSTRVTERI